MWSRGRHRGGAQGSAGRRRRCEGWSSAPLVAQNWPTCREAHAREARAWGSGGAASGMGLGFIARGNGRWACGAKGSGGGRGYLPNLPTPSKKQEGAAGDAHSRPAAARGPEFWKIAKWWLDGSPRRRLARLERVCEQGFRPCGPEADVLDAQRVHQPVVSTRDTHAAEPL